MSFYNMPESTERIELLKILKEKNKNLQVSPEAWAFFWTVDIGSLEDMVANSTTNMFPQIFYQVIILKNCRLFHSWVHRMKEKPSYRTSSLREPEIKSAHDLCLIRDQHAALAIAPIKLAYICPLNFLAVMAKKDEMTTLNEIIYSFFPTKEQQWIAAAKRIFDKPQNLISNMFCIPAAVHDDWCQGKLALEPLSRSADNRTLEVRFHRLIKLRNTEEVDLLLQPGSAITTMPTESSQSHFFSGAAITFYTDDPIARPLPDIDLLEMQWIFQRGAALAGATSQQYLNGLREKERRWRRRKCPSPPKDDEFEEDHCEEVQPNGKDFDEVEHRLMEQIPLDPPESDHDDWEIIDHVDVRPPSRSSKFKFLS